ncbi:MAG: orotidine-5'-phosphate decarboxylase [Nitrospirae bacterium]|nr:orotidine-5'-phosphate decarboxylase [Nitrospirota bacterium]
MTNPKGIIFAADILEKKNLLAVIKEVSRHVDMIKIGNLVLYEHGWKIIEEVKEITQLPVLADLKIMDIPDIAEQAAKSAKAAGADSIMVCGPTGWDTIDACLTQYENKNIFIFTEFTHCTGLIDSNMADEYIDIAVVRGCGIQIPGTKGERITQVRERVGNDICIICCGVGSQYSCDSKIIKTKFGHAIAAGADFEIIGRAIYKPPVNQTPQEIAKLAQESILREIVKKGTFPISTKTISNV